MTFESQRRSTTFANSLYGVADYLAQPATLLCATPFLMRRLGVEQFALWVLASAAVTGGMMVSSGLGDAAVKYISGYRGRRDAAGVERIFRALLGINLIFGSVVAAIVWAAIPFLVSHLPGLNESLRVSYKHSLQIGCLLLIVRSVDSVFVCTQRAFERYGTPARLSIGMRIATIVAAAWIAARGGGVTAIMCSTLAIALLGLGWQGYAVWRDVRPGKMLPRWDRATLTELFGFGCFSWLQALIGLFSGQADRWLVGYLLGPAAVVYYSICVQAAQPIHGIASSGLHVLFPHLGARFSVENIRTVRRKIGAALAANAVIVAVIAAPFFFCSHLLLRLWMGEDFAVHASATLVVAACGYALLGLNVTGHYILMALGRMRFLALLNLAGAAAMLAGIALLAPQHGILGAALGRLLYGPITWLAYRTVWSALRSDASLASESVAWRPC